MERALSAALSCLDGGAARWLLVLAALGAAERVAFVAAAVAFVEHGAVLAAGIAVALAALAGVRRLLASALRSRAQAGAYRAAARALLASDPMDTTPLGSTDPQSVLYECTYAGAELVATQVPEAAGDAVAVLLIGAWLGATQQAGVLLVGGLALAASAAALLVARRVTGAALARSWEAHEPVYDALGTIVKGRLELRANGSSEAAALVLEERLEAWMRAARSSSRFAGAAGRAPIAAGVLAVAVAVAASASLRGAVEHAAIGQAAILASAVPAFTGLLLRLAEAMRSAARFAPMVDLLALTPRAPHGGATPPSLPADIVVEDVSYTYPRAGHPAVEGASFAWRPGTVLVLRGPNGTGKSTLLRVLAGLAEPSRGTVTFGGVPLADLDLRALGEDVAYLAQDAVLQETCTVAAAMAVLAPGVGLEGWKRGLEEVELLRVLERKSPSAPLDVRIGQLSSGQRQRVALARVLCRETPVVLLDEPDASLDAVGLDALLRAVAARKNRQMIAIAAHSQRVVEAGDVEIVLGPAPSP